MVTQLPFDAAAQVWLRAAGRGVTWFETRLEAGCRLPAARHDLGSYYKWPLALAACGRTELARQVLDVIVDDFMTVDGDFRSGDEKSGDPIYGLIADTYTNTWPSSPLAFSSVPMSPRLVSSVFVGATRR